MITDRETEDAIILARLREMVNVHGMITIRTDLWAMDDDKAGVEIWATSVAEALGLSSTFMQEHPPTPEWSRKFNWKRDNQSVDV